MGSRLHLNAEDNISGSMLNNATIFITGFPGFIAGRLLRDLAREPARFILLVHPAFLARAREELQEIALETGRKLDDFRIVEGDITSANLGLSAQDLDYARAETSVVFHLAAFYDLAVDRETAMRVNVAGTKNVNDFVRSLPRLRHYHYVSTCYVAGKRKGVILESELRHEAGFRNNYEETKYLAELEVESLKPNLPVTIHRPSVVCGDSKTGETIKYDGIYYLIRYLMNSSPLLSAFNIGNSVVTLNLVPVDFVVAAMTTIARDPNSTGKTLQIADPQPMTTEQLFNTIARCINGKGSRVTLPKPLVETFLLSPISPPLTGLPHSAVPYFFLKQTYDTSVSAAMLGTHGLRCPPFDSYAKTLIDFVARHPTINS
jgi:thioester reductase-like protein